MSCEGGRCLYGMCSGWPPCGGCCGCLGNCIVEISEGPLETWEEVELE